MCAALILAALLAAAPLAAKEPTPGSNPIIRDRFTADAAVGQKGPAPFGGCSGQSERVRMGGNRSK
jgi:hypothetical protein